MTIRTMAGAPMTMRAIWSSVISLSSLMSGA